LTTEEMELICGVYKVDTNANQSSDLSWWPKPKIWERSGLNVGYWSPSCEEWYQTRLQKNRDRTGTLKNSNDWNQSMVLQKKQAKLASMNEHFSARFLNEEHFP
ncbi:hypothetical protein JB92DRAFT_2730673, partial [Gautieria morchelliformis]